MGVREEGTDGKGQGNLPRRRCGLGRLQLGGEVRVKGPGRGDGGPRGVREQVAGGGSCGGPGSRLPSKANHDAPITVTAVQSQDQRRLQLILGLGGGREGSFARVHLGGSGYSGDCRVDPPAPHILLSLLAVSAGM